MVLGTPKEAAETAGVSLETLRRWVRDGKLSEHRTAGGHRRYDLEEIQALVAREDPKLLEGLPDAGSSEEITPGIVPLGLVPPDAAEDEQRLIGIRNEDLDQHLFMCGRTGSGKSELLKWMILGVTKAAYPLVVVDPHGALVDDVLNTLVAHAPERLDDIVYLDFGDEDWPVGFNPLDVSSSEEIEPVVAAVREVLDKQLSLGKDAAPRAVNYAVQALTALCEANLMLPANAKCNLLHLVTFFLDPEFRQIIVAQSQNHSVRETFDPDTGLFEQLADKERANHVQPIIRAFQPLGNSRAFSAVFSASENRLDFTELIGQNKIVLVKLARHHHQAYLGEMIGSLLLSYLLASLGEWGRQRDPVTRVESGRGCRVFIDEAPTLLGPDSAAIAILAEARKYDLGLVFASQFLDQFDVSVVKHLLANITSKLSFVLEPSSARLIAQSIAGSTSAGAVTATDIATLRNYHFYSTVLYPLGAHEKRSSGPFLARTPRPLEYEMTAELLERRQNVIDHSRLLTSNRRTDMEVRQHEAVEEIKGSLAALHALDNLAPDFGIKLSGDPSRIWKDPEPIVDPAATPDLWKLRLVFDASALPEGFNRAGLTGEAGCYPFLDLECQAESLPQAMAIAADTAALLPAERWPPLLRIETVSVPG
jgi:excisionase family DNA binding protein